MNGDIINMIPQPRITLTEFDAVRAELLQEGFTPQNHWITGHIRCPVCSDKAAIEVNFMRGKEDRYFEICLQCLMITPITLVYEQEAPKKRQSKVAVLQTLINQIPLLDGRRVEFKRGHGYYIVDGEPIYFQYYDVALRWLTDWIVTGERPSDSRRTVGMNGRRQAQQHT